MKKQLFTYIWLLMFNSNSSTATTPQKNSSIPQTQQTITHHQLVDIKKISPTIRLDIVYATPNNFTKQVIYTSPKCYLLKEVAEQLHKVQQELAPKGLGLLIWDGYRPLPAQWKLWNICPDERYVSDPRKGGRHTRGTAVDVTLIKLTDGKQLEMPTGFDDFTEKAWRNYTQLSDEVKKNRQLLQDVMEKYGFIGLPTEWWHFDYKDWKNHPPLDIDFDQLASKLTPHTA